MDKEHLMGERPLLMQIVFVASFLFIVFMLFALAESIYRDTFQVGGYIEELRSGIEAQKQKVEENKQELDHVQTPQYKEKVAKELLGMKAKGEEVYVISNESQSLDDLLPSGLKKKREELLSNPQKWMKFVFGI